MDPRLHRLGEGILAGGEISPDDAMYLLGVSGPDLYHLLAYANEIRTRFCGDRVELCSIINARAGNCSENCSFCVQSAHHGAESPEYPLIDAEEVLKKAKAVEAAGVSRFDLVTAGYGFREDDPDFIRLLDIYRRLRRETNLHLCACLGNLTPGAARALAEAGVTRYNHNLEAARSFFPHVCTTHTYEDRLATVRAVKETGMEVCCGVVIGMGETPAQRVELAFALKELEVETVPINVLNPRPGTPLEGTPRLQPEEILKTFAVFRFIMPERLLRFAGGREVNLGPLQPLGFLAGLNAMLTGGYLTTPGQEIEQDLSMVSGLGLVAE